MTDRAESADRARLFLVTPLQPDPATFPAQLAEALGAAEIAAVLFSIGAADDEDFVAGLVGLAQAAGAAALVADDTRIAGRLKADGVHIGSGAGDLRAAVDSFQPKRIVGAGNIHSRHTAMEAGEIGADYLFFGKPHGDTHDAVHPKALDLAGWWSGLMELPAVLMAGRSLTSVAEAATSGVEFVALRDAVWSHRGGPGEALREAVAALGLSRRRAA